MTDPTDYQSPEARVLRAIADELEQYLNDYTGERYPLSVRWLRHQAAKLTHFEHYCTCGGHAWRMNNRQESNPHMEWCPQKPQYDEWWKAMHPAEAGQ